MKLTAIVLGIAVLAGCTRFHPQPLSSGKTAADFESRSLTNTALKAFLDDNLPYALTNWPASNWDLEMLTLVAFYYHPSLDVARAQWAVARGGETTAGGRPNPTLNITPGYNSTTFMPSPWFPLGFLDIPIETAGKRGYRRAQAAQLSEAARLNIATVAWQVRSRLRRSLLDFYGARETESLLQQQQATQTEVVRLLEAQLSAGEVSPFEVTQARIALDNTRLALRDAERQHGEAHAQLASALGLPASALDDTALFFAAPIQPPTGLPASELRRQALLSRVDILGALAEYAAAESALRIEIAKQYPDIHLQPGYQFDQGDNKWALGVTLELPVLNQNQGPIAEAKAKREEAAARFTALQASVVWDLDRTTAAYSGALAKVTTAEALLENLKKQEQTTHARLEAGDISKLELSTVQLELGQTALTRLDALVKAQQAFGELEDTLQSPLVLPNGALREAQQNPRRIKPSSRNEP